MTEIKNPDGELRRISPGFSLRRVGAQEAEIHFEGPGSDHTWGWPRWTQSELANLTQILSQIHEMNSRFSDVHNEGFWATREGSRIEFRRSPACGPCLTCEDWELDSLFAGLNALTQEQAEEAEAVRHARIAPLLNATSDDRVLVSREDLLALADIEWAAREYFNHREPVGARKRLQDAIERHCT